MEPEPINNHQQNITDSHKVAFTTESEVELLKKGQNNILIGLRNHSIISLSPENLKFNQVLKTHHERKIASVKQIK